MPGSILDRTLSAPCRTLSAPCPHLAETPRALHVAQSHTDLKPVPPQSQVPMPRTRYVHVHLISDATGETLIATARAAAAQFPDAQAIEHVASLVRTPEQLERALAKIEEAPGIVLYTLVDPDLALRIEARCREIGVPCAAVLAPILSVFDAYLQMKQESRAGAQHTMDAGYFRRIDALNFVMAHDDGHLPTDLGQADVILVGVSRTSKTPTAIYLANRGVKAANVPLVPSLALPEPLARVLRGPDAARPLVVGLVASVEHILQIRRNRLDALGFDEEVPAARDRDPDGLDLDLLSDDADFDLMPPGGSDPDGAALRAAGLGTAGLDAAGLDAAGLGTADLGTAGLNSALPNTALDGVSLAPIAATTMTDGMQAHLSVPDYVDRASVAAEIAEAKALCARHGWPMIDVTRRSIEETAAAVIALLQERSGRPVGVE